ncbi:serine/threonine protein kinase [Magnetococcus marinus MC-1]|uniref:Serine/threonine protein kinase n=1 Tax=Magnetococcus marinus (strain ATCC BAA-1437 / JCM 17883 / MC-1) TaxID=156889 RepID=A0LD03_MAGMM|nr:serine/threonine-protein kinase [Magnetococcus marinus]ABK45846.1 serine/threonine protein kinase [Magnetococcus marinus MC-1]
MHNRALPEGYTLGNYQIHAELARSSFAIVYLAFHASGPVVVKEFMPQLPVHRDSLGGISVRADNQAAYAAQRQRFRYETQLLAHLKHPSIPPLLDHFDALGSSYMVLRYVQGEDLESLAKRRFLNEWEILQLLSPICQALSQLHELGQSHLNLRPSTLLIQPDGQPMLTNFGSAWSMGSLQRGEANFHFDRGYSALEMHTGEGVGPASDLYTLGATLHRLLVGEPPINSVVRHLYRNDYGEDPYRALRRRYLDLFSPALLEAVDCALTLDVAQRPADIQQWLERFDLHQPAPELPRPHPQLLAGDHYYRMKHRDEAQLAYMEAAQDGAHAAHRATAQLRLRSSTQEALQAARDHLFAGSAAGDLEATVQLAKLLKEHPQLGSRGMTAATFYKQAAQQGHSKAMYRYAMEKFTQALSDQIGSPALDQAINWLWHAALAGFDEAQWALAQDLDAGLIPCNENEAHHWLTYAAHQGWIDAQLRLAKKALQGTPPHIPPDPKGACYWYQAAAESGEVEAQLALAELLMRGRGTPRNTAEALYWRQQAALQGSRQAHFLLAMQYYSGNGVPKNLATARRGFESLALGGHGPAQKMLAQMLMRGEGVMRNRLQARHWYREAAKAGVHGAQEALQRMQRPTAPPGPKQSKPRGQRVAPTPKTE